MTLPGGYVGGDDWEDEPEPLPVCSTRRVTLDVICCPACQSLQIGRRNNGAAQALTRWECKDCTHSWNEPASLQPVRGWTLP
jgi:hypothetical protein